MIHLIHADGRSARLRWTDQHARSSYGLGVLMFAHSADLLDGAHFATLAAAGAVIECTTDLEARRAAGALAVSAAGFPMEAIRIKAPPAG